MERVKIIHIALGYKEKSTPEKIQLGRTIVEAMTNNGNFLLPIPALNTVLMDVNNLSAAYIATFTQARGTSSVMRSQSKVLQLSLQSLAFYVEGIANANPDMAMAIVLSSGMPVKNQGIRPPRILSAKSMNKGEITLTNPFVKHSSYRWEMTTASPGVESNWKFFAEDGRNKIVRKGLVSATYHYFRVFTLSSGGTIGPSQVVSAVVQ
jgi:hypothetical protein